MTHELIACPHYVAVNGSRRCVSYVEAGGCKREDTFMCTEWLRKNGRSTPGPRTSTPAATSIRPALTTSHPVARDLFGEVASVREVKAASDRPPRPALAATPTTSFTRPITEEQIKALEGRGVELCVRSDATGELWLVPAYTGAERNEMTFRDAATIAAVCAVFPGAEVTRFEHRPRRGED